MLTKWTIKLAGGGDFWIGGMLTSTYEPQAEEPMYWNEFKKAHPDKTNGISLTEILDAYKEWAGPVDTDQRSIRIDPRQLQFEIKFNKGLPMIVSPATNF